MPGMKVLVTLERDETGMLVAECLSIPGCVSQGAEESEALENIREAIAGCLEARRANRMPLLIDKPRPRLAKPGLPNCIE
jgi:predicted RNase H-like HicB family nuclease